LALPFSFSFLFLFVFWGKYFPPYYQKKAIPQLEKKALMVNDRKVQESIIIKFVLPYFWTLDEKLYEFN